MSRRPSPAMVIALTALFVALSGITWAATLLKPAKNSVKSKHIKDGQVASVDVADNGLTGVDIDETTLSGVPSGSPSGAAGGDLTGSYPNPNIAANAVTSGKVADGTLSAADVNPASIQQRVSGSCPAGQAAQSVTSAGSLNCGVTNDGTPGGSAGGDLTGSYPAPTIASGAVTTGKIGNLPSARVSHDTGQSIPDESIAVLSFNTEEFDTAGLHDNATNNDRLTAPVAGVYLISASVRWDPDTTGSRSLAIVHSAVGPIAAQWHPTGSSFGGITDQNVSTLKKMNAGESVSVHVYQDSGDPLLIAESASSPALSMAWMAPG